MLVNEENCIGCGLCVKDCFPNDIKMVNHTAVIQNHTCIKCGHCIAVCPQNAIYSDEYSMDSVKEFDEENFSITPENLLHFIQYRRSVRQFTKQDVTKEDVLKIVEAGRFTQTGINMQDVSYTIVKDKLPAVREYTYKTLKEMGEELLKNADQENPQWVRYGKLWFQMYEDFYAPVNPSDKLFFYAPVLIVVSAYSPVNAALASSNMELMTNALGLGTFFSGFFVRAAQANKNLGEMLGIEKEKQITTCMVIGHPNVQYKRTVPRKEAEITWK